MIQYLFTNDEILAVNVLLYLFMYKNECIVIGSLIIFT